MTQPDLRARSSDGTTRTVIPAGAALPASARIVFATTRAAQDEVEIELIEGVDRLVAKARFTLPRGLPPNTWIPIEIGVDKNGRIRAEARENLRRIRVDAKFDTDSAEAGFYSV